VAVVKMTNFLKTGVVVSITTQEDYNEFVSICGLDLEDGLHIDKEYVAYLDIDGAVEGMVHIVPLEDFREAYPLWDVKPRKFKVWKRSVLR